MVTEMFRIGDKVYCKSMKQNLVVGCKEGENASICINVLWNKLGAKRFGTFIISNHDLVLGWKSDEELKEIRDSR